MITFSTTTVNWDEKGWISTSVRDARHKYGAPEDMEWFQVPVLPGLWKHHTDEWESRVVARGGKVGQVKQSGQNVIWFQVPDSREGWAKGLEIWEVLASEKVHHNSLLILDFSPVRPKNNPIGGMQKRPASGPVPLMSAFMMAASLKGAGLSPWKQTLFVDHFFAECVLVGGARRAARMSTKYWRDKTIFDFIRVKRPIEFQGKTVAEVTALRKALGKAAPYGFLWSSNNSIAVDEEFWALVKAESSMPTELELHAKAVFKATCEAAYGDGIGEPGVVNVHKLVQNDEGIKNLASGDFVESERYKLNDETQVLMSRLAKRAMKKRYHMIVNPCGEIVLLLLRRYQ